MWNKVYFLALAVAAVVMGVLAYLAFNELQKIGFAPATIAGNFLYYESMYHQFLWMSSVLLLIVANVVLWQMRQARALWTTLVFFAVFVMLDTWWLGGLYSNYKQTNLAAPDSFSFSGIVGAILCVAAALIIFFNHFIVLRMRDRINGVPAVNAGTAPVAAPPVENK